MKSVLITGGTGSFGQAFTKRLLQDGAERIVILSRNEHAQAEMRERLSDDRLRFFLGDVRDRDRLRRAFCGVDTVIHAAALKRIEVGAYDPIEMVKTNIGGTVNVIEAAIDAGVRRVVGLSSDKAWQPISPYGQTKALAESLLLNANNLSGQNGPKFVVTRYGNVAGSRGSVIPRWKEMKRMGMNSVPVTDPDCTRFYMRMDEAVDLVLRATKTNSQEILIPTLPAYRLGDLADVLKVKMDVKGLPAWEKKHEGMDFGNTSDIARRMDRSELAEAVARL
jgi:UDP-N-acetylglucosamine 4,6-dehydratase